MPADMFLKLEGIPGESTDDKHKNEIDVESFSWGLTQTGTVLRGGGAGTASYQDFHFTKILDKSSPLLFLASASGQAIREATLTVSDAGQTRFEFLKITLSDLVVSSFNQAGTAETDRPTDQFSLNFSKIEFEYTAQKADGTAGETVKAGWDLKANKKV